MKSIEDLFHALLQEAWFAERQMMKMLPEFADASASPLLRNAINMQRFETQEHIERIEQIVETVGRRARGRICDAIMGIFAGASETMKRAAFGNVRDAAILAALQAAEHHQIARYSSLVTLAERLDEREAVELLGRCLGEEQEAVRLLDQIAAVAMSEDAAAA